MSTATALICEGCGIEFERQGTRGPVPRFHSNACRSKFHYDREMESTTAEQRSRRNQERYAATWQAHQEAVNRWKAANPASVEATRRRYVASNRHKVRAQDKVKYALRMGRLTREPCLFCGADKTVAHHHDYDCPLDVTWLCAWHHQIAHGKGVIRRG